MEHPIWNLSAWRYDLSTLLAPGVARDLAMQYSGLVFGLAIGFPAGIITALVIGLVH